MLTSYIRHGGGPVVRAMTCVGEVFTNFSTSLQTSLVFRRRKPE